MNSTLPITAEAAESDASADARLLAQLRDRHLTMLWIAIAVIVAAFLLQTRPTGAVGPELFPGWNLPELCSSRSLFGVECPGCGLTRSFLALARGDFATSLTFHRLGWFMALAVVMQIPYRVFCLCELRTRIPTRVWPTVFGYVLLFALLANWLAKVAGL